MVSFIISAKEKKKRETYEKQYAVTLKTDPFDVTVIERDTTSKPQTQSIGIETVKLIQKKLFLKPIKSAIKLLVIEDAQLLTPEAQNALLKVLEEPPDNTHILLGTETTEALLPTILSRCRIIELEEEKRSLSKKTVLELSAFIENLPEMSVGERMKKAESLSKEKEKAISFLEDLILLLREQLLQTYSLDTSSLLRKFQTLHTLLKTTNVNPRFAIEHTLLTL